MGEAMVKARDLLKQAGFVEAQIEIKVMPQKGSVAKDILEEAESDYDLIVMGRNGKSGVKEFLLGSIPLKVFNHAKQVSLLVVS